MIADPGISSHARLLDIPRPRLQTLRNATPFSHFQAQKMGKGREAFDTVLLKGSFALTSGELSLAAEQTPITLADEYYDEADAAHSSVRLPGELIVGKPSTDVIVTGHARAKANRPAFQWECGVTVRRAGVELLRSRAIATGPRRWTHRALRGWKLSDPEPTVAVPIRYELAYGGWYRNPKHRPDEPDDHANIVWRPNPSGTGFFDEESLDRNKSYPGPQWESPAAPIHSINRESPLVGFGPIARMWSARAMRAGTYDAEWMRRMREDVARGVPVDYPEDFDERFFQCAHPLLIAPSALCPGDTFELEGLLDIGPSHFILPSLRPYAEILVDERSWVEAPLPIDMVHVDLDARRVHLSWRLSLPGSRGVRAALITTDGEPS